MMKHSPVLKAILGFALATLLIASQARADNLINQQWKIYNIVFTPQLWDINKAPFDTTASGISFPISPYVSTTNPASSGSFAVYLSDNYNNDLTGMTITASASWTVGIYDTRSTLGGGRVRIWFQDTSAGTYGNNDYWWCTTYADMTTVSSATLTCPLTAPAQWTNLCGYAGDDTADTTQGDCINGGTFVGSPASGFIRAAKKVKQLGLSFGNASRYASGIAVDGQDAGTFTLSSFTISP